MIRVRFAPSPTGLLHIGSARTALFNWLFAKKNQALGAKFLLRVEDTDRARSTNESIDAIFDGLQWLGLDYEEPVVFQFSRASRHREVAEDLLQQNKAYACFCTPQELAEQKEKQLAEGASPRYNGKCASLTMADFERLKHLPYAIRLRANHKGVCIIEDIIQGVVEVKNKEIDDIVLLRSDGTPTYMLSVVVDDYDMGITHIIRGDDHLTNAFRQKQIYEALNWQTPFFAHIPLIHGEDGAKLSKRHGAVGVSYYRDLGILPVAMRNYLMRLGWGHGNEEIFSGERALELFSLEGVNRSPARLDLVKLLHLNYHYMVSIPEDELLTLLLPYIFKVEGVRDYLVDDFEKILIRALPDLKTRSKTLVDLASASLFLITKGFLKYDEHAEKLLKEGFLLGILDKICLIINEHAMENHFTSDNLKLQFTNLSKDLDVKLGTVAQILRAAISYSKISPGIFEMMEVLGCDEIKNRLNQAWIFCNT